MWIRNVAALRDVAVGWRFISLLHINAGKDMPQAMLDAQARSHGYLRVCAAARDRLGNDVVGDLYRAFGERFWYTSTDGDFVARFSAAAQRIDVVGILDELGLPNDLADAAADERWDAQIAAESDEAFRRTGPGVGTPIISYDPPHGAALFGPVISTVPDDDETDARALRRTAHLGRLSRLLGAQAHGASAVGPPAVRLSRRTPLRPSPPPRRGPAPLHAAACECGSR